jgi:hypothetical protein
MTCPNSQQDCDDCPFKQDPNDHLRWVCIKCKNEYSFRQVEFGFVLQFVLTFILSLLVLLWLSDRPLSEPVDQQIPTEVTPRNV